jgi:hypothetical protein
VSRHAELAAVKAEAARLGHEMGNAVNMSPFANATAGPIRYTVRSTCRMCRRWLYVQKEGDEVVAWGDALRLPCGSSHVASPPRD